MSANVYEHLRMSTSIYKHLECQHRTVLVASDDAEMVRSFAAVARREPSSATWRIVSDPAEVRWHRRKRRQPADDHWPKNSGAHK